ncbi:MAG TPA: hypothetical protein VFG10_17635 [Saprospiraceae bacterium]|nr:hypothetical protein [Saprospiraceae bacterium]
MKFKHAILLSSLFLIACSTHRRVSFRVGNSSSIYKIDIPKGFTFQGIAGDHEFEKRYWYSDSSVIYITTFSNTINYDEIRKQGKYYEKFDAVHSKDTINLEGKDGKGLYWMDRTIKSVTFGYSRVPADRKYQFDLAIESIK